MDETVVWPSRSTSRDALPRYKTRFVGRERELDALSQCFDDGARLVTLHGPGGAGKTRLAIEWASRHREAFEGGVYFCDPTSATTSEELSNLVAGALNVTLSHEGAVRDQLANAVAAKGHALLILDNVEHFADPITSSMLMLLAHKSKARFLLISQTLLHIEGERVIQIEPMPTAPLDAPLDALEKNPAVALFVDRARATQPAFELTKHNAKHVATLVQQLDGLPLAIELAATRVRVLPVHKISDRLTQRFKLLKSPQRDLSARHATLQAAIDWSWQLLEESEREALHQCALFRGGFTLEAGEAVIDLSDDPDAPWPMDVLTALCDKSFLYSHTQPDGDVRLQMSANIRAYVTMLEGHAPSEALKKRFVDYYAQYGAADVLQSLTRSVDTLREMRREHENLQAAWALALGLGDVESIVRLTYAVCELASRVGPYASGIDATRRVLSACKVSSAQRLELVLYQAVLLRECGSFDESLASLEGMLDERSSPRRGRVYLEMGRLENKRGHLGQAIGHLEHALELLSQGADKVLQGKAHFELGSTLTHQGRNDEAEVHLRSSLELATQSQNLELEGLAHSGMGHYFSQRRDWPRARAHFEASIECAKRLGDKRLEGGSVLLIGEICAEQGEFEEARAHFLETLALAVDVGSRPLASYAHLELGNLERDLGHYQEARVHYTHTLHVGIETGSPSREAWSHFSLAGLRHDCGELEKARSHYTSSLEIARRASLRSLEGWCVCRLAMLDFEAGDDEASAAHFDEAEDTARALKDQNLESWVQLHRSDLDRLQGRHLAALRRLESCEALGTDLGDDVLFVWACVMQSRVLVALQRLDEAVAAFERATSHAYNEATPFDQAMATLVGAHLDAARGRRDDVDEALTKFEAIRKLLDMTSTSSLVRYRDEIRSLLEAPVSATTTVAITPTAPRPAASSSASESSTTLVVEAEGRWFELGGGERVSMGRRRAARLVFKALVQERIEHPGEALLRDDLFEAGWPGEHAEYEAAAGRVYTAIRDLRRLGLGEVIVTLDEGYLIPLHVDTRWA